MNADEGDDSFYCVNLVDCKINIDYAINIKKYKQE